MDGIRANGPPACVCEGRRSWIGLDREWEGSGWRTSEQVSAGWKLEGQETKQDGFPWLQRPKTPQKSGGGDGGTPGRRDSRARGDHRQRMSRGQEGINGLRRD